MRATRVDMADALQELLVAGASSEARALLARMAGVDGPSPAVLCRLAPPDRLARIQADGRETLLPRGTSPQGLAETLSGGQGRIVPLNLAAGRPWGFWILPAGEADGRMRAAPLVEAGAAHFERLREMEDLRRERDELSLSFDLGPALAKAEDPSAMVAAVQAVAGRAIGAASATLLIPGEDRVRVYRCEADGEPSDFALSLDELRARVPQGRAAWTADDPAARAVSGVLGAPVSAGMAEPVGAPDRPAAYLVLLGGHPFPERARTLFTRMADLVSVSLQRWEQLEGVRRKSRQVADLFVLLAQEKERLDYVMRSVPVGLLLTNAEGVIQLANEAAGKALGLTDVELREKKIFTTRPEGQEVLGLIEKAKLEGKAVATPYEMEGRWFHLQVVPWPGGAQYLVVAQDIQDWYQLNRLKEDLIAIISHEVKNPLTAVINASHLLASGRPGPLSPHQARVADLILENSRRIKELLDDVVRLSRVYQLSVRQDPIPLKPILEKLREGARDTIHGKLIAWREDLQDVTVPGEPRMLENLFTNLVGNAVKYTGIGGRVGVRLWAEDGWARFRVCDDGPGIPARERDSIFAPFFRASNVREQVSGTGLGLVIAKNIAERFGGRIDLASPISPEDAAFLGLGGAGRPGTAFQVDLPLGS